MEHEQGESAFFKSRKKKGTPTCPLNLVTPVFQSWRPTRTFSISSILSSQGDPQEILFFPGKSPVLHLQDAAHLHDTDIRGSDRSSTIIVNFCPLTGGSSHRNRAATTSSTFALTKHIAYQPVVYRRRHYSTTRESTPTSQILALFTTWYRVTDLRTKRWDTPRDTPTGHPRDATPSAQSRVVLRSNPAWICTRRFVDLPNTSSARTRTTGSMPRCLP